MDALPALGVRLCRNALRISVDRPLCEINVFAVYTRWQIDKRCGSTKTLQRRETRTIRAKRSEAMAELKVLGQQIRRWQVKR